MTIKIYSCAGSRGMRPIWTAEEMGLDYEVEMMPFPPRFLHKDFMDINILGTVPYLIDGEVRMTESVAMSQFMVDRYGPSDLKVATNEDDYGDYLNWLSHSDATLTFPQTVFLRYTLQEIGVADKAAEGYRRWFIARLKLLEQSLNDKEYLCSNRFTIADICVCYALFLAKSLGIDEAFKPNISRWTSMLFERKAFKKIKDFSHDEVK